MSRDSETVSKNMRSIHSKDTSIELQLRKPEPYDFQRTLNWLSRQVAPTLQVAEKLDKQNNTTIIKDMIKNAKLTDRLEKVLKQLSVTVEEMTVYDKED